MRASLTFLLSGVLLLPLAAQQNDKSSGRARPAARGYRGDPGCPARLRPVPRRPGLRRLLTTVRQGRGMGGRIRYRPGPGGHPGVHGKADHRSESRQYLPYPVQFQDRRAWRHRHRLVALDFCDPGRPIKSRPSHKPAATTIPSSGRTDIGNSSAGRRPTTYQYPTRPPRNSGPRLSDPRIS